MRWIRALVGLSLLGIAPTVEANLLANGLNTVAANSGIPTATAMTGLRPFITTSLIHAISFLALLAVTTIVIAGIVLIAGVGTDASKERAKKIVLYTLIGLVLVYFAKMIVTFINTWPT